MIPAMGFDFPKTLIKADAPLKKPSDAALLTLTVEAVAAEADVIATEPTENTEMAANAVAMILVLNVVFVIYIYPFLFVYVIEPFGSVGSCSIATLS